MKSIFKIIDERAGDTGEVVSNKEQLLAFLLSEHYNCEVLPFKEKPMEELAGAFDYSLMELGCSSGEINHES